MTQQSPTTTELTEHRLTAIQTSHILGARAVDVKLTKPVTLFAGRNGAGKSSLQEAVRMALTGEPARVGLKKAA